MKKDLKKIYDIGELHVDELQMLHQGDPCPATQKYPEDGQAPTWAYPQWPVWTNEDRDSCWEQVLNNIMTTPDTQHNHISQETQKWDTRHM